MWFPDPAIQRPRRRPRALAAAFVALAIGIAGCSSGSDQQARDPVSTTTTSGPGATTTTSTQPGHAFEIPAALATELDRHGTPFQRHTYPEQPADVAWPTADWPTGPIPDGVDTKAVDAIVAKAFGELSNDTGTIDAILVVSGGRLVVEKYNGWDPEATHNSWSMAKSINSALVGILVGQGKIDIGTPFPAPEWRSPGDPRAAITWDELLRMSSGLAWDESYTDPKGDVIATLGADNDRAGYVASKPLAHPPGSTWSYSTGTANLLARGVADIVGHGDALTGWIDRELFHPLGITKVTHNVDRTGVISGGSFIDLRPRDFARFGLLYDRGGVWNGTQLLPQGWVDYSRMPTPSNPDGTYGAQWWVMPDRPVFYANGYNGQSISVAPDKDLVVVVLSKAGDGRDEQVRLALLDAFGA